MNELETQKRMFNKAVKPTAFKRQAAKYFKLFKEEFKEELKNKKIVLSEVEKR